MRETDLTRRFSKLLREARIASGMSQEQLANQAGVHRTHISLIERSRRSVRLETLERLARALDIETHPTCLQAERRASRCSIILILKN